MNAGLNKEQIEYIQSIIGKTEMNYQKEEDDYTDEEWDSIGKEKGYNELSEESDGYWWELISDSGLCVDSHRNEDERRWYNVAYQVRKIGERYFELMYVSENRSEQQSFSDIIRHYGSWSYNVEEVFPYEKIVIDYK